MSLGAGVERLHSWPQKSRPGWGARAGLVRVLPSFRLLPGLLVGGIRAGRTGIVDGDTGLPGRCGDGARERILDAVLGTSS